MNASTISAIADTVAAVASLGALASAFRALWETRQQREILAHQGRFQTTPFVLLSIDKEDPQPIILNTGNTSALRIRVMIPAGDINGTPVFCRYQTVPHLRPGESAVLKVDPTSISSIPNENLQWLDCDVTIDYKDIIGDSYANVITYKNGEVYTIDAPLRHRVVISSLIVKGEDLSI